MACVQDCSGLEAILAAFGRFDLELPQDRARIGARQIDSRAPVRRPATGSAGSPAESLLVAFNQLHRGRGKSSDDCRTNPYAKAFGLPCVPTRADRARRCLRRATGACADRRAWRSAHHPARGRRPPSAARPQIQPPHHQRWPGTGPHRGHFAGSPGLHVVCHGRRPQPV